MKILINTITPTEIAVLRERDERFTGIYEIRGELFIPGEWKHVPDDFNTSAYPLIKEVSVVLAERTKKVLEETGLNNFAQGVKEGCERYSKPIEPLATDILKYAPRTSTAVEAEPIAEEEVRL